MRKIASTVVLAFLAVAVLGNTQATEETKKEAEKKAARQYVGVTKCAMCHKAKARGNQVAKWKESKHASAYAVLATDAAKELGKKAGVEAPQKSPKCLKCHVTAYGVDKELLGPKYSMEDGVGCESCHGPGADYMKLSIMKDKDKAVAAGLVAPTEEVCVTCHNEESPSYKKFDFKEFNAKIAHPRPKAEAK